MRAHNIWKIWKELFSFLSYLTHLFLYTEKNISCFFLSLKSSSPSGPSDVLYLPCPSAVFWSCSILVLSLYCSLAVFWSLSTCTKCTECTKRTSIESHCRGFWLPACSEETLFFRAGQTLFMFWDCSPSKDPVDLFSAISFCKMGANYGKIKSTPQTKNTATVWGTVHIKNRSGMLGCSFLL